MPITVLYPQQSAERCYLVEAVNWVSFARVPLAAYADDADDGREDWDQIEGIASSSAFNESISSVECLYAGLSPNPEYQLYETDGPFPSSEVLKIVLVNREDLDPAYRSELEAQLQQAKDFERRQALWDEECDHYLDAARSQLFLGLRQGILKAFGVRLSRPTVGLTLEYLEETGWEEWGHLEWEPIATEFWHYQGIDWTASRADGRGRAYGLILIETDTLMRSFPARMEPVTGVVRVGESFLLTGGPNVDIPSPTRRGRPALNWDSFHLELARRVKAGELPAKQESLIADMQAWCRKTWGKDVGRSTLLEKIKPYYDALVRRSENH